MSNSKKVQRAYLNRHITGSFAGLPAFVKSRKYSNYKQIAKDLQELDAYTLHKRVLYKYPRRKVRVFWEHYQYGMDLMQISKEYSTVYSFILIVIDNFSRRLYYSLLKSKSASDVERGLVSVFRQTKHYPRYIFITTNNKSII